MSPSFPDPSQDYQRGVIEKFIEEIGLRQDIQTLHAGKLALAANYATINKGRDSYPYGQLVLSVDFSRSGTKTLLFCESMGVTGSMRQIYHPDLILENPSPKYWEALKADFAKFLRSPFGESPEGKELPNRIYQLVLYGDLVPSKNLLGILGDVLGADVVARAHVFDPVFASAVGMARASLYHLNNIDFNTKAALGCRWRSNVYHGEL